MVFIGDFYVVWQVGDGFDLVVCCQVGVVVGVVGDDLYVFDI